MKKRISEIKSTARSGGYALNPDEDFVSILVEGLLVNNERYGFEACPCRLIEGKKEDNLDIECPCDYRDGDLDEYGACFCALYVNEKYDKYRQIPEARPVSKQDRCKKSTKGIAGSLPYTVWRCPVCGYLCAVERPPKMCPICRASGERFEEFM